MFIYEKLPNHLPEWLCHFIFSSAMNKFLISHFTFSPALAITCIFNFSSPNRYIVIFAILWWLVMLSIFTCAYLPFVSLVKCLCKSLAHFLIELIIFLLFKGVLYIFLVYFLPGCSLSFHPLNWVLHSAKVFNFDQFIIFPFKYWCHI